MKTNLQELFKDANHRVRSYSGRGMYGKNCLGVTLRSRNGRGGELNFVADVLEEILGCDDADRINLLDEFVCALKYAATDSMGLGSIIYFPDIPFEGEDKEDDEDDY